jgi:hypothetical protein
MKNKKSTKNLILHLLENELLAVLAVIILLGVLIGYSLAATKSTFVPITPADTSTMHLNAGDGEVD